MQKKNLADLIHPRCGATCNPTSPGWDFSSYQLGGGKSSGQIGIIFHPPRFHRNFPGISLFQTLHFGGGPEMSCFRSLQFDHRWWKIIPNWDIHRERKGQLLASSRVMASKDLKNTQSMFGLDWMNWCSWSREFIHFLLVLCGKNVDSLSTTSNFPSKC